MRKHWARNNMAALVQKTLRNILLCQTYSVNFYEYFTDFFSPTNWQLAFISPDNGLGLNGDAGNRCDPILRLIYARPDRYSSPRWLAPPHHKNNFHNIIFTTSFAFIMVDLSWLRRYRFDKRCTGWKSVHIQRQSLLSHNTSFKLIL